MGVLRRCAVMTSAHAVEFCLVTSSMRSLPFLLMILVSALLSGCQLLQQDSSAEYQTVAANPQRDTEEAEEEYEKATKIILRYLERDRHHADLGEAEHHLQKALVADVTHAPSHNALGVLYLWKRDLYLAAWEFEYANKLVPWTYEPLHNLGMVYDAADRPDQAVCYYEMALDIAPQNPEVIGNLARARLRRGDSIDAVRPLLKELMMADHREEWLDWASEQLGLNPLRVVSAISDGSPVLLPDDQPPEHGLEPEPEDNGYFSSPVPPVPPESAELLTPEPEAGEEESVSGHAQLAEP